MTYDIRNVNSLESSAATLNNINQKVANDVSSLANVINEIKANWQNEEGADLASIITELENCVKKVQTVINPTVEKYVNTMNILVEESRTTQSRAM